METFLLAVVIALIMLCILACIPRPQVVEQVQELTPYELLQRETFLRALEGNKSAREWVEKHVIGECGNPQAPLNTPQSAINDAVDALVKFGHRKLDARKIVNDLVSTKDYKTCQQIILDAMKK
jgi:hypothetical protein